MCILFGIYVAGLCLLTLFFLKELVLAIRNRDVSVSILFAVLLTITVFSVVCVLDTAGNVMLVEDCLNY